MHGSNLRWDFLAELFKWAVPDILAKVQRSDAVEKWTSLTGKGKEDAIASILRNEMDDLVERRNEVAHRAIPDEILSHEHLLAKVDYVEAISLGIISSLADVLLTASIKNGESALLGAPTEYFKKKRVVVIRSLESPISEGDHIIASGNNSIRWGRVLEIRVADVRTERADVGAEAGLLLDFEVRRGSKLHIWQIPNSDLTSRPDGIFGNRGPLEDR
jgi:hypothetical protein